MKTIEIIMRIISFCMGILLACSTSIKVRGDGAVETLCNTLFVFVYLAAVVALLVLPWALPLRNQ